MIIVLVLQVRIVLFLEVGIVLFLQVRIVLFNEVGIVLFLQVRIALFPSCCPSDSYLLLSFTLKFILYDGS